VSPITETGAEAGGDDKTNDNASLWEENA